MLLSGNQVIGIVTIYLGIKIRFDYKYKISKKLVNFFLYLHSAAFLVVFIANYNTYIYNIYIYKYL